MERWIEAFREVLEMVAVHPNIGVDEIRRNLAARDEQGWREHELRAERASAERLRRRRRETPPTDAAGGGALMANEVVGLRLSPQQEYRGGFRAVVGAALSFDLG